MAFTDYLDCRSAGLAWIDAQSDFLRARREQRSARIVNWVRHRRSCHRLRALPGSAPLTAGPARLEVVPLRTIVGTLEPTANFDANFRPASNAVRSRWERIALAHRKGDALPPVVLRWHQDGYYVVDGRHRVAVARALRHRDIDAWVRGRPRTRPTEVR